MSTESETSGRHSKAQAAVAGLSIALVLCNAFGLRTLKVSMLDLELPSSSLAIPVFLLVTFLVWMELEWMWVDARRSFRDSFWHGLAEVGAVVALLSCYQLVTRDSEFRLITWFWLLAVSLTAFVLAELAGLSMFAALLIRSPTQAHATGLPRIPIVSRNILGIMPIVGLMVLAIHQFTASGSPSSTGALGSIVSTAVFLIVLFKSLLTNFDRAGIQRATDAHDYMCLLSDLRPDQFKETCEQGDSRHQQKSLREAFGKTEQAPFYVKTKQSMTLRPVRVSEPGHEDEFVFKIDAGGRKTLRVDVILQGRPPASLDAELRLENIEGGIDRFLTQQPRIDAEVLSQAIAHGLNDAAVKLLMDKVGSELYRACLIGHQEDVVRLIGENANVESEEEFGWTPLLIASAQGYPGIVRMLLRAGANPNRGNLLRRTPLMFGARYGNAPVCDVLVSSGANIDAQDIYGDSALMIAANYENPHVVELLLKAGANFMLRNRHGESALDLAQQHGQGHIANRLRALGAEATSETAHL